VNGSKEPSQFGIKGIQDNQQHLGHGIDSLIEVDEEITILEHPRLGSVIFWVVAKNSKLYSQASGEGWGWATGQYNK